MSNKEYPCCGYVLPVSDLRSLIPFGGEMKRFDELLESQDWGEMREFHDKSRAYSPELWGNIPLPNSCFVLNDEATPNELEIGVMYADFDESDLYIKTPTVGLCAMKEKSWDVRLHSWSVYG